MSRSMFDADYVIKIMQSFIRHHVYEGLWLNVGKREYDHNTAQLKIIKTIFLEPISGRKLNTDQMFTSLSPRYL